jgi:hypothetical protein
VRCLLGSIFPLVVVHGGRDLPTRLALVDEHDRPFSGDFTVLAGRPVVITGTFAVQGGRHFLSARAADIESMR